MTTSLPKPALDNRAGQLAETNRKFHQARGDSLPVAETKARETTVAVEAAAAAKRAAPKTENPE